MRVRAKSKPSPSLREGGGGIDAAGGYVKPGGKTSGPGTPAANTWASATPPPPLRSAIRSAGKYGYGRYGVRAQRLAQVNRLTGSCSGGSDSPGAGTRAAVRALRAGWRRR